MKSLTFPHALAYIFGIGGALLPIIQQFAPAFVPGPTGLAIAGVAGALLAAGHQFVASQSQPLPPPSGGSVVKMLPILLACAVALAVASVVVSGLSACATLAKVDAAVTSPQAQPVVSAAALVAVGTAEQHGVKAADINRIAKLALAADSGTTATLATVAGVVNAEVAKLNLPQPDVAAIGIVEASLGAYIQAKVAGDPTVAATQAAVADVLQAVIAASGG